MESPTGIIPEELMHPKFRKRVIEFLEAQAFTGDYKRSLLLGWAKTVGVKLRQREYETVRASGIDAGQY